MKRIQKNRSELDYANKLWHFMDKAEEKAYYDEVLERVIHNPRFYLDNLDDLSVFRVSFIEYKAENYRR
jgi:hypothetical protein